MLEQVCFNFFFVQMTFVCKKACSTNVSIKWVRKTLAWKTLLERSLIVWDDFTLINYTTVSFTNINKKIKYIITDIEVANFNWGTNLFIKQKLY